MVIIVFTLTPTIIDFNNMVYQFKKKAGPSFSSYEPA